MQKGRKEAFVFKDEQADDTLRCFILNPEEEVDICSEKAEQGFSGLLNVKVAR